MLIVIHFICSQALRSAYQSCVPSWLCHLTRSFKEREEDSIHAINFDLWSHSKQPRGFTSGLRGRNLLLVPYGAAVMRSRPAHLCSAFVLATCEEVFLLGHCPESCPGATGTSHHRVRSSRIFCPSLDGLVDSSSQLAGILLPKRSEESMFPLRPL